MLAITKLEDYGLSTAIISRNESRPSGELFINIKVELVDQSVLFVREYVVAKQENIEHLSYAYQYQSADESLIFRYDNAAHKPPLPEKEHKHLQNGEIIACPVPAMLTIVDEILSWLTQN
jgi:hypothetical protein